MQSELVCRYCGEIAGKNAHGRAIHETQWCPANPNRRPPFRGDPVEQRFWAKVRIGDGCWPWMGGKGSWDYGQISIGRRRIPAHRYAYELLVGPIPEGLVIDHLCCEPRCVNPWHMEPVTHRANILRGTGVTAANDAKTHCPNGHEYTLENTYITPDGKRQCRICQREAGRLYRERRRYGSPTAANHTA